MGCSFCFDPHFSVRPLRFFIVLVLVCLIFFCAPQHYQPHSLFSLGTFCVFSEPSERIMLTGRHWVRDVSCKRCNHKLGWMYELAAEDDQRYKEAKVILEKALVREKDGIQELEVTN